MTKALVHACLPSRAASLQFLRGYGGVAMPGAAYARDIVAIALPRPLEKLPCVVRDPDGGCGLLLLQRLGGDSFLVHPGGKHRADRCCNYNIDGLRLVTLAASQRAPLQRRSDLFPGTLEDVNCESPVGTHASLKAVAAYAAVIAEIYRARAEGRATLDLSALDMDSPNWSARALNSRVIIVWRDASGGYHVSIGPTFYKLVQHCSGAKSSSAAAARRLEP